MGQVKDKVAIVTGGASGIGAACAATLAREGAKVVVTDLDDAGGQAVVDKIGSAGGEAIFLHQDVSLEESWPGIIEATERRFGRLDVMVANVCLIDGPAIGGTLRAAPRRRHGGGASISVWRQLSGVRVVRRYYLTRRSAGSLLDPDGGASTAASPGRRGRDWNLNIRGDSSRLNGTFAPV
jgi:NAD(P)-dependent dehydrogenase (short-subunit alcohol dehydrogenase family)